MFVRALFASVAFALPCASAAAQHARPVLEALAAADLRVVAHAAVAARDCDGAEVKRALLTALRRVAGRDGDDAAATRLLLLDALWLREAKVPGDLLVPMLREPWTEVVALVLLCREPKVNVALRREHVATFEAVFDELVRRGLLASEAVPALRARVRVVVDDQRTAATRALPPLPAEVEPAPPRPDPPKPRIG